MTIDNLNLHSDGKSEYIEQLKEELKTKLIKIENDKSISESDRQKTIEKTKLKYKNLIAQADASFF